MAFLAPKKKTAPAKPAPKPAKKMKVKIVKKLRKGTKPAPKPLKITYTAPAAPPAPVEESLPLNPKEIKWTTPNGALIVTALSILGHIKTGKPVTKEHLDWEYATRCEALGVPPGSARRLDLDHLEELMKYVFHIYSNGRDPKKARGMGTAMWDLVFWPNFRGGFIFSPNS